MNAVEKLRFFLILLITKPRVLLYYFSLRRNERLSRDDLRKKQEKSLREYLIKASKKTSFFNKLINVEDLVKFGSYGILQRLPVVTKRQILSSPEDFFDNKLDPSKWKQGKTGGSTGTPFQYRLSNRCNDMAFAILYRGWGRGGYKLGDRVAVLAGGSLVGKNKSAWASVVSWALNTRKYSSYGVDEALFFQYYSDMLKWGPRFLQGYVSSICEFAKFLEKNKLQLNVKAIFTTAEMLLDADRAYIQNTFGCKVFNTYGLNDGGVAAFECVDEKMHIDFERAYLEVVDDEGQALLNSEGRIVATSLVNEATYFIRYDTGDLGVASSEFCSCGSPYPVLSCLSGRRTDVLVINQKKIGSPVLTVLMSNVPVNRYQFIQRAGALIIVLDVAGMPFCTSHEDFIRKSLNSQLGDFELVFKYGEQFFEKTANWKHQLIINNDR